MLKAAVCLAIAFSLLPAASGQTVDYQATGAPIQAGPADAEISAAIRSASPEKIHDTIETLVNFKNRMTTSSTEADLPPGTGVLAAAAWLKARFEAISKDCGGCLEVKLDDFVEPAGKPSLNGAPHASPKTPA